MASAIERGMKEIRDLIDQRSHTISLATARDKELYEPFRQCDYVEVDTVTLGSTCQIRFNSPSNPEYELSRYRRFKTTKEQPFKRIYLTNTAQAGKQVILKCGGDATMIAEREATTLMKITEPMGVENIAGSQVDPATTTDVGAVATAVGALQTAAETLADVITAVALLRWGIPREPAWEDGAENTAPAAGAVLVTKSVTAGKTGRVFGVHISSPEANEFRLYVDAAVIKRFALAGAGTIHIVLSLPLKDSIAANAVVTIKNVNAGTAGLVYQASLLYDEV